MLVALDAYEEGLSAYLGLAIGPSSVGPLGRWARSGPGIARLPQTSDRGARPQSRQRLRLTNDSRAHALPSPQVAPAPATARAIRTMA